MTHCLHYFISVISIFLTFIFVKQIALNMSKTLEWSVSQILKIKMIHKDSTCVYNQQDKTSRKRIAVLII